MTEPITTIPKAPDVSLMLEVKALMGRKHIQRSMGSYRAFYMDGSVSARVVDISANESIDLGAWGAGMIQTNNPVIFTGMRDGVAVTTIQVTKLLILDDKFDMVRLTLPEGAKDALVNLNFKN